VTEKRKLAAVMFTDIVGYTAIMSRDEQKALALLQMNRDLQTSLADKYNGEFLKEMGDGTLLCFQSALDAVRCAVDIQQSVKDNPDLKLRIGIHLGDIVFKESDVFGDGVNVASRIERLAGPRCICISEEVYRSVRNQPDINAVFIDEKRLKNVDQPVKIYTLSDGSLHTHPSEPPSLRKKYSIEKSIAVLPFVNMSADPEQEYFCDGMSEEILNALAQINNLRVIARTSAFAFKGQNIDVREIGKKLDVTAILEGSVRKSGNRIRVTAQLINAADGSHVWSERYDQKLADVFDIQDAITSSIIKKLQHVFALSGEPALASKVNFKAYDAYLKGRYFINKMTSAMIHKAIACFQESINIDPNYAPSYAALGDCYIRLFGGIGELAEKDFVLKAREAADKALSLDPDNSDAMVVLAMISSRIDWDWVTAEKCFQRALETGPGNINVYTWYINFLAFIKHDLENASYYIDQAERIDPLAILVKHMKGLIYSFQHQFDLSEEVYKNILDFDPNYALAHYWLGIIYSETGRHDEAVAELEKGIEIGGRSIHMISILGYIHGRAGNRERAEELLAELKKRLKIGSVSSTWVARIYAGLDDKENMYLWLDKAYKEKDLTLLYIPVEHVFDRYHTDDRFKALLNKIGSPP